MKILINALLLNNKFSGVQHSTQNLIDAINKNDHSKYDIEILLSKEYSCFLKEADNFKFKKLNFSTTNRIKRIYYEHFRLASYLRKYKFDLYHATGYISPYFSEFPTLLTVHDLIALEYPEYCQKENAIYFRLCLPNSILKAKKIIAVSNTVKNDIVNRFSVDPAKIAVIYHGVGKEFVKIRSAGMLQKVAQKYKLPDKFLLFLGNLEPKKNLVNLIRAFIEVKKRTCIEHKLVIAGKNGWKYEKIYKMVRSEKMDNEILFTGYVAQEDLPSIYSLSDLFVFPSLYEGFGLPVLEAMACETPVLISDRGALPEIAGTLYPQVNPFDIQDIANKMYAFISNSELRIKSIEHGIKRVKDFTWEKAASKTLNVYQDIHNN